MCTTITLDPDVKDLLAEAAHLSGRACICEQSRRC
jgi:hypothetical protein